MNPAERAMWVQRGLLARSFGIWQVLGLHITPNHFYSPVPDTRRLSQTLWSRHSEMPGVDMRDERQIALLQGFASSFREEYRAFPLGPENAKGGYYVNNGFFGCVDGEVLHCMIRNFRPKRIIEVGAGFSTLISAQAVLRNASEEYPCHFVSIDPYPPSSLQSGLKGLSELLAQPVESVGIELFSQLGENDILFIDSSHTVRIGGDVVYELLEVLPRLATGVIVHLHDIFLPAEYPRDWVLRRKRFWSEQYLLRAFLAFNGAFEVLWGASHMHLEHPSMLADAFPSYRHDSCWPSSFWIRRTA